MHASQGQIWKGNFNSKKGQEFTLNQRFTKDIHAANSMHTKTGTYYQYIHCSKILKVIEKFQHIFIFTFRQQQVQIHNFIHNTQYERERWFVVLNEYRPSSRRISGLKQKHTLKDLINFKRQQNCWVFPRL